MNNLIASLLVFTFFINSFAQDYYSGNDLSYVNQMEDCGAVFKEDGTEKDVYQIFKDHGTNLIRVRLWHNPSWQNTLEQPEGVKSQYSDYEDVRETIRRSKEVGMQVMLGFQFSDFWADPGRQVVPEAWVDVARDLPVLKDSVYNYVIKVLTDLHQDDLLPEFVKIGNETNSGIMTHESMDENWDQVGLISNDWNRHAQLYNIAIKAVRDFSDTTVIKPKVALHCAGLSSLSWWYQNIINRGVTDFDIIGFSYYYAWHGASIAQMGVKIRDLKSVHPGYEVMVVETGYLWTTRNFDSMGNIINTPDPEYLPVNTAKQLEYMVDLQREVLRSGGKGSIFWEPAWVSTPCTTPWGQGSSHDHVVYFDPYENNFIEGGGGHWMETSYYDDINSPKVTFVLNMEGINVSKGVYLKGSWSDRYYTMSRMEDDIYSCVVYDISPDETGGFYFLNDTLESARETVPAECALWDNRDRLFTVGVKDTTLESRWESCTLDPPNNLGWQIEALESKVKVFPNPGRNLISIQLDNGSGISKIEVVDINGIKKKDFILDKTTSNNNLQLKCLAPGCYFIRFLCHTVVINKKLIVL